MSRATVITPPPKPSARHHSHQWVYWVLGFAGIATVIIVATHIHEEEQFLQLVRSAHMSWLAIALVLQAVTYVAQGEIWRITARMSGTHLQRPLLYKLSLAKLFIDQAIPSAGMSGTVVVAQALEREGLNRHAVRAGILVNTTSFFIAYVASLIVALGVVIHAGHAHRWILWTTIVFILAGTALTVAMIVFTGKRIAKLPERLQRLKVIREPLSLIQDADPKLVRSVRLQTIASLYQLLTFALDAATLWALIRSVSADAPIANVFASFMIANVLRTVSFIPGGLGTFEAAAVYMLRLNQIHVAVGLSAVLLFRGITFFLPMAPGVWFSRHLTKTRAPRDAGAKNRGPRARAREARSSKCE